MLKTTELWDLASKAFKTNNNEFIEVSNKANKTVVNLSKDSICISNNEATKELILLILNAKKAFNYLR